MTTIHVEDVSDIKKKITFEVPEEKVRQVLDSEYKDLKKNMQLKGFRKGKVPLSILKNYFKDQVEADVSRKIVEETFQPGLDEKNITAVSVVSLEPEKFESGQPFQYVAEIEVPPPIEATGYTDLNLNKTIRSVNESQVQERIQNLRERNARLAPIAEDRGITTGDHIEIDVVATSDGESIKSLTVDDYHLELGRDFYIPGFDAELEGMKVDERKEITINLPEDFPRKDLAGKSAVFDVHLKEAKQRILPEPDDDFAKDMGDYENFAALEKEIRKDLEFGVENQTKRELENQVIDQLIEKNSFEVPESMIENQIDQFMNDSMRNLVMHGIDPKRVPQPTKEQRDQVRPAAERMVKAGLLLKSIAEKEKLEISDEEFESSLAEKAELMGLTADYLKDQFEDERLKSDFRAGLLQEKVYRYIIDKAEITETEQSGDVSESQESEK
jgi:trigger factor